MGYFYWLCVKNPNHLYTEISLDYLKDTKFYLESKAFFYSHKQYCFILAVFDCLVVGILHFFGQFRGQLEVLVLAKIHPVRNYFANKNNVLLSNFFSFSNMFFI